MVSVTVRYFASLRERLGRSDEQVQVVPGTSVRELWQRLSREGPLPAAGGLPENVLVSVNREYVRPDTAVSEGDEVAFFPPVTGG